MKRLMLALIFLTSLFDISMTSERGRASYYCCKFHGRHMAGGGRFNQNAMTAAHKHLPFGTKVCVKNLKNGRSVIVRITDRGPFVRGRIIDLSLAAARRLGMLATGTAPVLVTVIGH